MVDDQQRDDTVEEEFSLREVAPSDEEGGESTSVEVPNDQVAGLLDLEGLIKNHIESIDNLKLELKKHREMLEDSFESNPTYREHMEKVKDVTKAKNSVRQEIAKQPSVASVNQKVKDVRFDMNEKAKTLSDLLQDYIEQTGATQIETKDGKVLEIVRTSKLVRRP